MSSFLFKKTDLNKLADPPIGYQRLAMDQNGTLQLIDDLRNQQPMGSGVGVARGNTAMRGLSGRMGAFDNSTPKTFRAIIALAQHADRARVIFTNGATGSGYTVAGCNMRALPDLVSALPAPTAVTLPSGGVLPAAPNTARRTYLVSNWVDLSTVDRTDGGQFPLLCIDAYVSTASGISILGNGGSDNFANWATRPNGRVWIMRHNDGDCVTTPANFTSTVNRIQSPIVGVQYVARGQVITVMGIGDSVTDGRGNVIGEGFGVPACEALSSLSGVAVEWWNNGWAGSRMDDWVAPGFEDMCAAGLIPDIVVTPNGSPNNFGTPIVAAEITRCRQQLARILNTAKENRVVPIVWTVLPTNPAIKDYNSSDALRTAYNAATLQMGQRGVHVIDMASAISGPVDADGQVTMLSGTTTDNIHPNDAGNALLRELLVQALRRYVPAG